MLWAFYFGIRQLWSATLGLSARLRHVGFTKCNPKTEPPGIYEIGAKIGQLFGVRVPAKGLRL